MGELELVLRGREARKARRKQEREQKKAEATARKSNPVPKRRYALPLLAVGAFGFSLSGIVYGMIQEQPAVSLEQRISYPHSDTSRQEEYVRNLPKLVDFPDYLVSVEYSEKFEISSKNEELEESILRPGTHPAMVTSTVEDMPYKELGIKKLKAKTRIFPQAFERAKNEKEFLLFFRHELNQAKIIHEGFDNIPMDLFFFKDSSGKGKFAAALYKVACELESYRKDIYRAKKEGFDEFLINSLIRDYMTYQRQLKYIPGRSDPDFLEIKTKLEREFRPIYSPL